MRARLPLGHLHSILFLYGVVLAACGGQDKNGLQQLTPPQFVAGPSHVDMYVADTSMPLDLSVLVELANDSTLLTRERIASRLADDGVVVGSDHAKSLFAAFRGGDPSPVSGDDQELIISENNTLSYGPRVLLTVPDDLSDVEDNDLPVGRLRWLASIASLSSKTYAALKIEANEAACVYVGRDNSWNITAYLLKPNVSKGCMNTGLLTVQQLQQMNAKELVGHALDPRSVNNEFDGDDLPAGARWEWSLSKTQVIGVRCATRWCQIAPIGTTLDQHEPTPGNPNKPSKEERRNHRLKGWYDLQMLAHKNANGELVPSGVLGRIHPAKKSSMQMKTKEKWYFVAEIVLLEGTANAQIPAKYTDRGLALGTNHLEMCRGPYARCGGTGTPPSPCATTSETVWGRITSQSGTVGSMFPVCALSDPTYNTAIWSTRWSWDPMDEGMWVRCLYGCCSPEF